MTRPSKITVICGILIAGISLGSAQAEDRSAGKKRNSGNDQAALIQSLDELFPSDSPEDVPTDFWDIELTTYEASVPTGPAAPPPPDDVAAPAPPVGATGGDQGEYPVPPTQGPVPFYEPNFGAAFSDNSGDCLGGPLSCDSCATNIGTGSCSTCPGGVCQSGGSPIYIQDGWGDIFGGCCPAGLVAGVEGTFLVPIDEPTQRVILRDTVTGDTWSGDPRPGLGAGVRTWIGLQKCGWGVRLRYWHFNADNVAVEPDVPIHAQPTISEAYSLQANVLDLELTQRFNVHCWQIDTSFGARYADLNRYSQATGFGLLHNGIVGSTGTVDVAALAMGANQIDGTGFTASIGGRKSLSPCNPCYGWSLFWNARGSILWADSTVAALTDAAVFSHDPPGSANARNFANAVADHTENLFITDLQAGLEYRIPLCCGLLAFRAGVEYQNWDTGGLIAQSESFAFLQGGPPAFGGEALAQSDAHDGDLDLIGLILGVEWTF